MTRVWRTSREELSEAWATAACQLWQEIWPKDDADTLENRVQDLLDDPVAEGLQYHFLEDEGEISAVCRTFVRRIQFIDTGVELDYLALAGVCSSPRKRGKGFGKSVVEDAFSRVKEEGLSGCLFQTGVPKFYSKLGAFLVKNEFVNSRDSDAPDSWPWWDRVVMVYGQRENWGEGRVDLRGAGY